MKDYDLVKIRVTGGVAYLDDAPPNVKVVLLDEDEGDVDYHEMDITLPL